MQIDDIITIIILVGVLLSTCLVNHERGLEAASLENKIMTLEKRIEELRPVPRINVERASIYPLSGEVLVDVVNANKGKGKGRK